MKQSAWNEFISCLITMNFQLVASLKKPLNSLVKNYDKEEIPSCPCNSSKAALTLYEC